jgi:hypothetical protein
VLVPGLEPGIACPVASDSLSTIWRCMHTQKAVSAHHISALPHTANHTLSNHDYVPSNIVLRDARKAAMSSEMLYKDTSETPKQTEAQEIVPP